MKEQLFFDFYDDDTERAIKEIAKDAEEYMKQLDSDEKFWLNEIIEKLSSKLAEIKIVRDGVDLDIPRSFIFDFLDGLSDYKKEKLTEMIRYKNYDNDIELNLDKRTLIRLNPKSIPEIEQIANSMNEYPQIIRKYAQIFWEEIGVDENGSFEDNEDKKSRFYGELYGSKYEFDERQFFLIENDGYNYIGRRNLSETITDIIQEYVGHIFHKQREELHNKMLKNLAKETNIEIAKKMKLLIEIDDEEHLEEIIIQYYAASEENLESTIGKMFFILTGHGKDTFEAEIMLTIPREVIEGWGIKRGTFYENAPWNLVRLGPEHLFREGFIMKHCVGNDTHYAAYVMTREIEIWSLRNKDGSPRFTFHIEGEWDYMYKEEREKSISQIKGKGNRLPGYESKQSKTIRFVDELIFLYNLFLDMGVDISRTSDIKEQIKMIGEENLR